MQRETKILTHEYGFPASPHHLQLQEDMMERHHIALSHLAEMSKQVQCLRQENINLRMANLELVDRLNYLMIELAPFIGTMGLDDPYDSGLDSVVYGLKNTGLEERQINEKSPTSVLDPGRVQLPKSISVRSSEYLKTIGEKGERGKASDQNKLDFGTQKVYVKGLKEEQPVELEVYNQGMFKTELCNKWQENGTCPYGDNCQFAHGVEELRPVLRHPRYKTEVCRMVINGITCPYGHRCHFRHALTEQEKLIRAKISSEPHEPRNCYG